MHDALVFVELLAVILRFVLCKNSKMMFDCVFVLFMLCFLLAGYTKNVTMYGGGLSINSLKSTTNFSQATFCCSGGLCQCMDCG